VIAETERAFYLRWIVANGLAEAGGLGTTFVLGHALASVLNRVTGIAAILGGALAAVAVGMLLEGVLVGVAQERVLHSRLGHRLLPGAWIVATAIGAGAAWALGMIPSTVMALSASQAPAGPASEPPALVQYGLAAVLGLVTGPILGIAQWAVLRRMVEHAGHWLWANAVAWAVGMPLIFAGMDRVPWTGSAVARAAAIYVVCAVTGLVVGAIHGWILVKLLRHPLNPVP
jgi:hypothetical protein